MPKSAQCVIFLDIDGCLNGHAKQPNGYCGIDKSARDLLNRILEETGALLVISSAWRYLVHGKSMAINGLENTLLTHGVCCHKRVLDITDKDHDIWDRGDQIASWLRDHPEVERYVVIDNDDLGIRRCGHPFVQTDGTRGMTAEDADRVIAILKGATDDGGCKHLPESIVDGPRIPLVYGSSASVLCTACGSYRLTFSGACRWKPGPPDTSEREDW